MMPHRFGLRLRWWRTRRGLSQLDLANVASTTQRHVSFLESGRSQPSREMVLRLAAALDVPLRQQNALLLTAGFAPVWRESDLIAPELATVNHALDYMLAQQEPFAAIPVGETARAECTPLHRGRTTMVWQTKITRGDGRVAALVTQTQLVMLATPEPK